MLFDQAPSAAERVRVVPGEVRRTLLRVGVDGSTFEAGQLAGDCHVLWLRAARDDVAVLVDADVASLEQRIATEDTGEHPTCVRRSVSVQNDRGVVRSKRERRFHRVEPDSCPSS